MDNSSLPQMDRKLTCRSLNNSYYSFRFLSSKILYLFEQSTLRSTMVKNIYDLYEKQNLLKTESPVLEDDGDGIPSQQPWQYKIEKNDGLNASEFFLFETTEDQE